MLIMYQSGGGKGERGEASVVTYIDNKLKCNCVSIAIGPITGLAMPLMSCHMLDMITPFL